MILFDKKVRQIRTVPIVSLFYPPTCGICGKVSSNFLCNKCKLLLDKEMVLGLESGLDSKFYFQEFLYLFSYQGIIRKMILDYKFNDKSYLFRCIVNFLLNSEFLFEFLQSYDKIIPVPISKKRYKERGYNQSALIAKGIQRDMAIHLKYVDDCIFKVKDIIEQSKLNKEQRQDNIKNVYVLNNNKISELQNKKLLLVDDVFTTGSTVNECCRILQKAKPERIGVLVLAKD